MTPVEVAAFVLLPIIEIAKPEHVIVEVRDVVGLRCKAQALANFAIVFVTVAHFLLSERTLKIRE